MPKKMGRPFKEITKSESLQLRLSKETMEKLKTCAEKLEISRTNVVEKGVELVFQSLSGQ